MRGLKKLNLCLFSLLVATSAVSAQADVFSPKVARHGGAYIALEAFNAKATDTFLTNYPYATVFIGDDTDPDETFEGRRLNFDPDNEWGYRVAVGYDYPSCCPCNYGFSLEYTYFKTDDDRSFSVAAPVAGTFSEISPFDSFFFGDFTEVNAKIESRYDTVDLLAHHNRVLCKCIDAQFFAGARYLRLKESYHAHYFEDVLIGGDDDDDEDLTIHFSNRFNGIGPRVGLAAFYPIFCNFGITTEIAGNLIFGCSKSNYSEDFSSVEFDGAVIDETDEFTFRNDSHDRAKVVPGWSGKVGLAYHADFRNCSSLNIEVGVRGDKYYEISDVRAFTQSNAFESSFSKTALYHDFEIAGPYISVSYHM